MLLTSQQLCIPSQSPLCPYSTKHLHHVSGTVLDTVMRQVIVSRGQSTRITLREQKSGSMLVLGGLEVSQGKKGPWEAPGGMQELLEWNEHWKELRDV